MTKATRLALFAIMVLAAACAGGIPKPNESIEMGSLVIRVERAPGGEEFFRSEHHARIVAPDGTVASEMTLTLGDETRVAIPAGSWTLEAFTVFFGDFIQCTADPSRGGGQVCIAPSLGPSQVCSMPLTITAQATTIARFEVQPNGRCGLGPVEFGAPQPTASAVPARSADVGPSLTTDTHVCAGTGWPPFGPDVTPGLAATASDRSHLTIVNVTDQAWSYRLSGWETLTLEDCRGLVEVEIERGPIAAGRRVETTFGILEGRLDVPVTLGWWDGLCGEACNRPPVGGVNVVRSAIEPAAS